MFGPKRVQLITVQTKIVQSKGWMSVGCTCSSLAMFGSEIHQNKILWLSMFFKSVASSERERGDNGLFITLVPKVF